MSEDTDNRRQRGFSFMQLGHYIIGVIYLGLAFVFAFPEKVNIKGFALLPEKGLRYTFAALIGLYGLWRLYRGYQQKDQ